MSGDARVFEFDFFLGFFLFGITGNDFQAAGGKTRRTPRNFSLVGMATRAAGSEAGTRSRRREDLATAPGE